LHEAIGRKLKQRKLTGSSIPARWWPAGGKGGVGEHEGDESYLWVVPARQEAAGGGLSAVAVARQP